MIARTPQDWNDLDALLDQWERARAEMQLAITVADDATENPAPRPRPQHPLTVLLLDRVVTP